MILLIIVIAAVLVAAVLRVRRGPLDPEKRAETPFEHSPGSYHYGSPTFERESRHDPNHPDYS